MSQPTRSTDERGAVFVEKLIVILPLLFTFFATWELAELAAAKLVVERACSAASRAAMVVLPDDPQFYEGEPVGSYDGKRRDDVELAAGMVLSAIPHLGSDFAVDVSEPAGTFDTIDVSLTAPYECGLASIYCLGAGSIELTAAMTATYHGARYEYGAASTELGGSTAALSTGEGSSGDQSSDGEHSRYRARNGNGKRPRDCDDQCKDPTANIKPSPSLKNCERVDPDDKGPVYEYRNKGAKACPVTAVHLDSTGNATYCFKDYATDKNGNGPRNQQIADQAISGKSKGRCPAGTKFAVEYEPVKAGSKDSARVDLTPFAVANSTVMIPATVSGAGRSGSDDRADFSYSWEQFNKKNNLNSTQTKLKEKYKGYTWHHNKVVEINGVIYYEMVLVPTTIHETAPHAGGSAWVRDSGKTQTPTTKPRDYTAPTGSGSDLLVSRPGKPPNC